MSGLNYISMMSVGAMFYLLLILIIEFPSYMHHYYEELHLGINFFNFDFKFFNAFGVVIYAFSN